MTSFGKALERMDDIKKKIDTKLDAKFDELLKCLPQPVLRRDTIGRAQHVPIEPGQNFGAAATAVGASVAPPATAEVEEYYEDEVDQNQNYVQPLPPPPAGRPQVYIRNGRPAPPPQVRDHDHVLKLKLNIPPFEGRYVPDIYLTWELETEQQFTCLQYPEERRVAAAVCAFTSFACVWWSKHCKTM